MMAAYAEVASSSSCVFAYQNSAGKSVSLAYTDVVQRLFQLSFDPYHCAELRWGATGQELASCNSDSTKLAWYKAEQNLRNQIERTYDARMDYDLSGAPSIGKPQAPDVDLWGYLNKQVKPNLAAR
jgi:hypothetical protein